MTFSCSRVTWPALALRHPGPWARKISATSKARRDTGALASAGRPDLLALEGDALQRAHDLADRLGCDAGVERGGVELGMTEQNLDHPHIDVLLKQVSSKAMPQRVQRNALVDLGHLGGGVTNAIELARGHRLNRIATEKQPALWSRCLPPSAQQGEQVR